MPHTWDTAHAPKDGTRGNGTTAGGDRGAAGHRLVLMQRRPAARRGHTLRRRICGFLGSADLACLVSTAPSTHDAWFRPGVVSDTLQRTGTMVQDCGTVQVPVEPRCIDIDGIHIDIDTVRVS